MVPSNLQFEILNFQSPAACRAVALSEGGSVLPSPPRAERGRGRGGPVLVLRSSFPVAFSVPRPRVSSRPARRSFSGGGPVRRVVNRRGQLLGLCPLRFLPIPFLLLVRPDFLEETPLAQRPRRQRPVAQTFLSAVSRAFQPAGRRNGLGARPWRRLPTRKSAERQTRISALRHCHSKPTLPAGRDRQNLRPQPLSPPPRPRQVPIGSASAVELRACAPGKIGADNPSTSDRGNRMCGH